MKVQNVNCQEDTWFSYLIALSIKMIKKCHKIFRKFDIEENVIINRKQHSLLLQVQLIQFYKHNHFETIMKKRFLSRVNK